MFTTQCPREHNLERGQVLVEYALGLVLVSVVVILILNVLGGGLQQVYCGASSAMGADTDQLGFCPVIEVKTAKCKKKAGTVRLVVFYNENDKRQKDVSLVASPGGPMTRSGKRYIVEFEHECPVKVTVRASTGISKEVTIGK